MGIFDKLKHSAMDTVMTAATSIGNKNETFTLPEAALDTPFQTAALTVLALCAYAADRQIGQDMLNWLRGPRPLNGQDISFLNDRFRDGKTYLPFTYFVGSTPDNNYTPTQPYTIRVASEGQRWKMVPLGAVSAHRCPHPKSRRPMGVNQREDSPRNPIV